MQKQLQPFLETIWTSYHRQDLLSSDPLEFVHRFEDPWDQEVVALLAAQLAYGNVKQIRRSMEDALGRMLAVSGGPAQFVRDGLLKPDSRECLDSFVHRIHRGRDVLALLDLLAESWNRHGSLGAHLVHFLEEGAPDFGMALNGVLDEWKSWHQERSGARPWRSLAHFLAAPSSGSCCKRWCMLLRWMVRKDAVDLGLWSAGSPLLKSMSVGRGLSSHQLILPLDTHVGQICQFIGLTRRKSLNWKAAVEITSILKTFDPQDPVRYDFALARLGILDRCRKKFVSEICGRCELKSACQHAAAGRKSRSRK